jgi:hypothetical protein
MSPAAIISIAVAVIVVLAAIVLVTAARRADVRGAGALSRETRRRDKDAEIDLPAGQTGRAVERAVSEARSTGLVAAAPSTPVVWVPPDEDAIGVSRRQFLNRATVSLTGAGLTTFAAAGFVAFLWPTAKGGFGGKINVGKIDDVISSIHSSGGFFYNATARSWVTEYPVDAIPKAKGVAERNRSPVPEVSAPRLPRPELCQQSMVRMSVPRLAVQPGRREEGRPRTARHGSISVRRRRQWRRRDRHRHGVARPTDRHQHHRSRS